MFDAIFLFLNQTITHALVVIGVIGVLIGFFSNLLPTRLIPGITPYLLAIKIISIVFLSLGLYMEGRLERDVYWQGKVNEAKAEIAVKEAKIEELTKSLNEKVKVQIKTIKDVHYVNRNVIVEKEKLINQGCVVPQVAIDIHNAAAQNKPYVQK